MVRRVAAIPATATVLEACEFFVLYKFFAFPVIDSERRVVGVIDVNLFTEEMMEIDPEQERLASRGDEVFEALGFRVAQVRDASPFRVFRYRFPWLLATVLSGTICALLAGAFELTLARSLIIAFFLTMVLGLNESVSMQSMTVTIQALRSAKVTWRWFGKALRRELATAVLLGFACGLVVAAIVWLWRSDPLGAFAIGGSIALSLDYCVSFWVERALGFASAETGSEDRRRTVDPGLGRFFCAPVLFHHRLAGFMMLSMLKRGESDGPDSWRAELLRRRGRTARAGCGLAGARPSVSLVYIT